MERIALSSDGVLETLCRCLKTHGSVALVPTETVYGLVACADDPASAARIYRIKSRDTAKRLQWFVDGLPMLESCGAWISPAVAAVIDRFCPGPLMLIVPTVDGDTFGFRIPNQPLLLSAMKNLGKPLCATSANRSGEADCVDPDAALSMFGEMPDLVVDGGPITSSGRPSTIIDFTGDEPRCLRAGGITLDAVLEVFREFAHERA